MQEYPAAMYRQNMLRAVHEWVEANDYNERLEYTKVISMGGACGLNDVQSLNVFETDP